VSLQGVVQHAAIQEIMTTVTRSGITDLRSPEAVPVLRQIGGLTAVIARCLDHEFERWQDNPRALPDLNWLRSQMNARLSSMRERLQSLLTRIPVLPTSVHRSPAIAGITQKLQPSAPMGPGVYAEKWLADHDMGWKGKADLIVVGPDGAATVDFKTGEPKEEHILQLQIYGLLWTRDRLLNPNGRPPTSLTLYYLDHSEDVPVPTGEALERFQSEVLEHTKELRRVLTASDPPAVPSAQHCSQCTVRHLCPTYWEAETQTRIQQQGDVANLPNDFEVRLLHRHSARDWDIKITSSVRNQEESTAIMRLDTLSFDWMKPGTRLRLLNVTLQTSTRSDEGTTDSVLQTVLTVNHWSELYVV
jgi:hypothetical protein